MFKRELKKECVEIRENMQYFFIKSRKLTEIYTLPEDVVIKEYSLQNLPRNSFCFYENRETKVSLAIITIGKRLYIKPEFFLGSAERKLRELGLKKRQLSTPFSNGAIPYDLAWIRMYKKEYFDAEKQYMEQTDMLFGLD